MGLLSHADHRKFVEVEGWTKKGTARSKRKTGDHHRFTLMLATGDVLYTRVSHGSGQIENHDLVATIMRDQLRVTEADFYRCVNDGVLPPRPAPEVAEPPEDALDAKLVMNLIRKVGCTQAEVAAMSKDEAVQRWTEYLVQGAS